MLMRSRLRTHSRAFLLCLVALLALLAPLAARAQDGDNTPEKHGRKYKAPPTTTHIEVTVLKAFNKKPIMNAGVVFHSTMDGVDLGRLEMKTDPDGKAVIDMIPTGSKLTVQVIADGFSTYAEDFDLKEPTRKITVQMARPKAQVSAYIDNSGKTSDLKPGVQEPIRPKKPTASTTPPASNSTPSSAPASSGGATPHP
jgi:hypothetical protein